MASARIYIIGVASPYAWDVVESARRSGRESHCVDNFGGADARLPDLATLDETTPRTTDFVVGLSSATHRADVSRSLNAAGFLNPIELVDPTSVIASTVEVRHGSYVNAGVVVGSNSYVGCFSNLNRSASIGHDNHIGFAASIGPGAVLAGGIAVGAAATIGVGAVILPNVTVGRRAVVGAGAVVTRNVADFEVVIGNPARLMRTLEPTEEPDSCPYC